MKNVKRLTLYFVLSVIAVISLAVAVFIGNVNNRQEAYAETSGELVLATTSATATQNSEFSTNVYIEENSNVAGFTFTLNFDSSIVTIVKDKCVNGSSGATINVTDSGVTVSYASVYSTNSRLDLVTLVFKVNENTASGTYNSWLNLDSEGFYDAALNDLTVNYKASTLTVSIANIGDVYEDGEINSKDVIYLLQYLANIVDAENINLVNANAYVEDNNDDGTIKVNSRDSIVLLQYLAKMDVTIGVGEWTIKTIPTVTTAGTLVRKTAAGIETVALPVLNNTDYICTVKTQSTCVSYGVCEYTYTYNGVNYTFEAAGTTLGEHVSSDWTVVQAATCEESGLKHKVCTVCGAELETEAIAATGHTYGEWTVVQAATCEESGIKHKVCTVCGTELETETIAATGHTYGDWTVVHAATCEESGLKHKVCTVCGTELETEAIAATGHNYGDWAVSVEPTLTSTGTLVKTCANNSSHKQTASLPALNQTDYTYTLITAATCVTEGKATYSYSKDGQYFAFSVTTAKTAHTEVADAAVAATCTSSGLTAGSHCSVCGQILVEQTVIPATEHTPVVTKEGVSATCSSSGLTEEIKCSACGLIIQEQTTIALLSHTDSDHDYICDTCGELTPDESEYTKISTVNGLKSIVNNMGGLYILTANINLTGSSWTPIGSTSNAFTGLFNGNGYTISGLTLSASSSNSLTNYGLFVSNKGMIANLKLSGVTGSISTANDSTTYNMACLSTYNYGTIYNCSLTGTNTITVYHEYQEVASKWQDYSITWYNTIGGICATNSGDIIGCTVSGNFNVKETIMGYHTLIWPATLNYWMRCYSYVYFGCIAGSNSGTVSECTVSATSKFTSYFSLSVSKCAASANIYAYAASIVGVNNGTVADSSGKAITHSSSDSLSDSSWCTCGITWTYTTSYNGLIASSDKGSVSYVTFLD